MARFDELVERLIRQRERGFQADPNDKGNWTSGTVGVGELKGTKYGVTWITLNTAIASGIVPPGTTIADLTVEQAKAVYRALYWDPIQGDELPPPIDEYLFDYAVNSGVRTASLALQAAVGALQDGWIGPKTLQALKTKTRMEVVRLIFVHRAMTFALSPNDEVYGRGWFARLFDLTMLAASDA